MIQQFHEELQGATSQWRSRRQQDHSPDTDQGRSSSREDGTTQRGPTTRPRTSYCFHPQDFQASEGSQTASTSNYRWQRSTRHSHRVILDRPLGLTPAHSTALRGAQTPAPLRSHNQRLAGGHVLWPTGPRRVSGYGAPVLGLISTTSIQSGPAEDRPGSWQVLHTPDTRQDTTVTDLGIGRGWDPHFWDRIIADALTRPTSPTEHDQHGIEE
jgi:hypothetical protein